MSKHQPTELNLHRQSKVLEISFDDGASFNLPCEYLRVFSPSAEVQGHGPGQEVLQVGKEDVSIDQITPVGNYAVCLHFDDGHNTGIYSWDTLYNLGANHDRNWADYLDRLKAAGQQRKESNSTRFTALHPRLPQQGSRASFPILSSPFCQAPPASKRIKNTDFYIALFF